MNQEIINEKPTFEMMSEIEFQEMIADDELYENVGKVEGTPKLTSNEEALLELFHKKGYNDDDWDF